MLVTRDLCHFHSDCDGLCEAFFEHYSVEICYTFSSMRMLFDCFYALLACQTGCFEFDSFSVCLPRKFKKRKEKK